ncbi:hypothetical protein [Kitasatospora sp. NPDC057015]|uniref:hypothetical protein n=1 Tax=Kitasatospora sp. NPDC057015 TaxID=3346001 RepID=UPI0036340615
MNSDNTGATADLADALDDFTERTATPNATRNIQLTVAGPHDPQQRTTQTTAHVADRITALLRAELDKLDQDPRPDHDDSDDQGYDLGDTSEWLG